MRKRRKQRRIVLFNPAETSGSCDFLFDSIMAALRKIPWNKMENPRIFPRTHTHTHTYAYRARMSRRTCAISAQSCFIETSAELAFSRNFSFN